MKNDPLEGPSMFNKPLRGVMAHLIALVIKKEL
jgi:hypothetical protein